MSGLSSSKFYLGGFPPDYIEGAENVFEGAEVNFNSKKIALREIGTTNKHSYTNSQIAGHGVINTSALTGDTFTLSGHGFTDGDEIIYKNYYIY